jgi:hypothetical protein
MFLLSRTLRAVANKNIKFEILPAMRVLGSLVHMYIIISVLLLVAYGWM